MVLTASTRYAKMVSSDRTSRFKRKGVKKMSVILITGRQTKVKVDGFTQAIRLADKFRANHRFELDGLLIEDTWGLVTELSKLGYKVNKG